MFTVRGICDHAWTRRASPAALFLRIRRILSGREIGRSIDKARGIGTICLTMAARGRADDLHLRHENRFHHCGDRAMSAHDGRSTKPLPEKETSLEH
jgi:hypothetical protein